ncbi:hypothetical protein [Rhodococcus sp. H29-C3]|uniref:hypothetical protein n=1 Tax=Rhodococcus sp. H29-C3 TaxID=3046307 RepID=UPI0024BB12C0|nr:hypothetical protein [Rhodococcus sp. H29-C3]MDJ0360816.1 hypothetical protein [Rhodococcus sp. H29-C3]
MSDPGDSGMPTAFQVRIARLFFTLPASGGFLLAGGATLVAQNLSVRPTRGFGLLHQQGWVVKCVSRGMNSKLLPSASAGGSSVFRTLRPSAACFVHGDEDLLMDLALDSVPGMPATASVVGPTFAPEELAGRKVVALFDRAEARDFVYALRLRFERELLSSRAGEVDAGFDPSILASMLDSLKRFPDNMIPVPASGVSTLENFFAEWAVEMR